MEFGLYTSSENNKTSVYNFGGLNRTRRGGRSEFSDMHNMSAKEYPCISPCGGRETVCKTATEIKAVCAPDSENVKQITGVTGIYDGGFYYNGILKSGKFRLASDWLWQIERKGNVYIINGYNPETKKSCLYHYSADLDLFEESGKVMRNLIVTCGTNFLRTVYNDEYGINDYSVTTSDGDVIQNRDFFLDYRDYTGYDSYGNTTMSATENIFQKYFEVGDELTIEGFPEAGNDGQMWNTQSGKVIPQPGIGAERNNTLNTDDMISTDSLKDYVICTAVIKGFNIRTASGGRCAHEVTLSLFNKNGEEISMKDLTSGGYFCSGITLKKRTRMFDNITVHHGRIWGTSPSGDQIYASSADDLFSFSAADIERRYAARIHSDTAGAFTALCSFNNDFIAFKSDSIMIVSGSNPNNYTPAVIDGIGCISGRSVAVTPDGVVFLSRDGFYIYNGSLPYNISHKLNKRYIKGVGGYDGSSYYASVCGSDGENEFLVYNMQHGVWHKQDNKEAAGFFRFGNDFYFADKYELYKTESGTTGEWSFTLMRANDNRFDNKGINEIWVRAEVSEGAWFNVSTAAGNGQLKEHSRFNEPGLNIHRCPVRLEMGESYIVKVSGAGDVVIYELELRKSGGGRRYKEY